jgi:hypothetical protein
VRHDVIGDACDRDDTTRKAHGTQWVVAQLGTPTTTPAFELIPFAPGTVLWMHATPTHLRACVFVCVGRYPCRSPRPKRTSDERRRNGWVSGSD